MVSPNNQVSVECPFNLETVFTLEYSTDGLKGVLKWIIDNLGAVRDNVGDLQRDCNNVQELLKEKIADIEANTVGVKENADEIARLRAMVKDLEAKSQDDESRVSDMNVNVENLNMNVSLQHRTVLGLVEDHKELIDRHERDIEELKNRAPAIMPQMTGGGVDMGQMMKLFACKDKPDNTINRIEALESINEDILRRVKALENRADKTDNRLDADEQSLADHERRIKALEGMDFGAGAPVTGDLDTAAILKQVALVKTEQNSMRTDFNNYKTSLVQDLEALRLEMRGYTDKETNEVSKNLSNKINSIAEKLQHELERLRAEFETFKNKDHKELEARVTALEKKFLRLSDAFANLKIPESSGGGGVSQEVFDALVRRVDDLEMQLAHLRDEFAKWMKEMQDSLNQKADFNQMDKALQDRLSDIVKALTKQFADKADTRKALKLLERNLQNLYNLFTAKGAGGQNEEDAMFSKKPLGGLSCASCEKGLVDMYGKRVEFMPWNKLPFRDPAERIARVGQGFSKMLSMINPDQLSRYEQNSKMANGKPMHMSQAEPLPNGQQEQFYENDMNGRTQTRFPAAQRFTTSDGKRPTSAKQRQQQRSKQRKM